MKKNLLIMLSVGALLASCSEEPLETASLQQEQLPQSIGFQVYTNNMSTKGVVVSAEEVGTISKSVGMGVFAFYQPAVAGEKSDFNIRDYATPDFMYNQQVRLVGSSWSYSPLKYWPGNANDQLSFFAYAPYDENVTWSSLGLGSASTLTKLKTSFAIHEDKAAMEDILFASPQLNKVHPAAESVLLSPTIGFSFRHILSALTLKVSIEGNTIMGEPGDWEDDATTITVDKVVFSGLADSYDYTMDLTTGSESWTPGSGTQSISLSNSNGDFNPEASVISDVDGWNNTAMYHELLSKESSKSSCLFLAPQSFTEGEQKVTITYTVSTDDEGTDNDSKVTNVVEKNLSDIFKNGWVSGHSYVLNFLISMTTVELEAGLAEDWPETPSEAQNVVPQRAPIAIGVYEKHTEYYTADGIVCGGTGNWQPGEIATATFTVIKPSAKEKAWENIIFYDENGDKITSALSESDPEEDEITFSRTGSATDETPATVTVRYKIPEQNPLIRMYISFKDAD